MTNNKKMKLEFQKIKYLKKQQARKEAEEYEKALSNQNTLNRSLSYHSFFSYNDKLKQKVEKLLLHNVDIRPINAISTQLKTLNSQYRKLKDIVSSNDITTKELYSSRDKLNEKQMLLEKKYKKNWQTIHDRCEKISHYDGFKRTLLYLSFLNFHKAFYYKNIVHYHTTGESKVYREYFDKAIALLASYPEETQNSLTSLESEFSCDLTKNLVAIKTLIDYSIAKLEKPSDSNTLKNY